VTESGRGGFSILGDGSVEADRLVAAAAAQRRAASRRVDSVVPGFDATYRAQRCGLDTPAVLDVSTEFLAHLDARSSIDRYFAQGDLSDERANVVDDATHRGQQIAGDLHSPRQGPTTPVTADPFAAVRHLRADHTLVLNDAQQRMGPHAIGLCEDIALAMAAHVQLNTYVSVGRSPGFGVHWDDHDVLVIQVAGRKYWEVQAPTELGAIKGFTPRGGSGEVIWSGILEPGRALSIPRGWAHSVEGLDDELSAHLTISIGRMTGVAVLHHALPGELAARAGRMSEVLDHCYGSVRSGLAAYPANGPIEVFHAQQAEFADSRFQVRLVGGAVFVLDGCDESALTVAAAGRTMVVPRPAVAALATAMESDWCTVESLASASGVDPSDVVQLVGRLGALGVLRLEAVA
jgi:hypothetical protein